MSSKDLEYYMNLPYKVEIFPDDEGQGYTAVLPELPGCMTAAKSFNELSDLIDEAKELWLEVALENNDHIPEPMPDEIKEYSGKFLVRMPKSLHRQLSVLAETDETSLNQLVVSLLSESIGRISERKSSKSIRSSNWDFGKSTGFSLLMMKQLEKDFRTQEQIDPKKFSWTSQMHLPAEGTKVYPK